MLYGQGAQKMYKFPDFLWLENWKNVQDTDISGWTPKKN